MAAGTNWYGRGLLHLATDTNWLNDDIRVALATSAYTPAHTHEFFSQVTGEPTASNGYTPGGQQLLLRSVVFDPASNQARLIADPAQWTGTLTSALTARWGVIYKYTGTAATSPLLGWVDLGGDVTSTAAPLIINFDRTLGVLRIGV
jgi:hypothetical protein